MCNRQEQQRIGDVEDRVRCRNGCSDLWKIPDAFFVDDRLGRVDIDYPGNKFHVLKEEDANPADANHIE